eukprot:1833903-Pleurochrysis_carterae.AAC.2
MSSPSLGLGDTPRLGAQRWRARQVRLERVTGAAETYRQPSNTYQVLEQLSRERPAQGRVELVLDGEGGQHTLRTSSQVGLCSGGGGGGLDCGAGGAGEETTGAALGARAASVWLTASGAAAAEVEASAVERRRQQGAGGRSGGSC